MTYRNLMLAGLISLAPVAALADTNYIIADSVQDVTSTLNIDLVRSAQAGTIAVYQMRGGEPVALIGTSPVNAGANSDLKVQLSGGRNTDMMVALYSGTDLTGPMLDTTFVDRD